MKNSSEKNMFQYFTPIYNVQFRIHAPLRPTPDSTKMLND